MLNHIKSIKFVKDESGNVLIMVASFVTILFAINGAAIDFGITQLVQMKKQQASDIATLASAQILSKDSTDPNETAIRTQTAARYYNLNFPNGYFGVETTQLTYQYNKASGNIYFNSGSSKVKTNFISTSGTSSLGIGADTRVNIPTNKIPDFDVVMVVDESGSTREKPKGFTKDIINTEKDAITSMIDVLFPNGQAYNSNLRFGLIGYTGAIVQASPLTADKENAKSYIQNITSYYQNYDHWGLEAGYKMLTGVWNGFTPPQLCGKAKIIKKPNCIPNIVRVYGKNQLYEDLNNCFTVETCIPQRNTDVPPPSTNRSDKQKLSKVRHMVLLSDGYIMVEPSPCPSGNYYSKKFPDIDKEGDDLKTGDTCKNYRAFTDMCKKIKDEGIVLHVISFVSQVPDDVTHLENECASEGRYYFAPNGDELKNVLSGIAQQVQSIRITE